MQGTSLVAVRQCRSPQRVGNSCSWGAVWLCGTYIWWRRLLDALLSTLGNFANFHRCQEWGNGRCPWVCNHQPEVYLIVYKVCQRCDIHTGVGFCVARSDSNGHYQCLYAWDEWWYDSHAFFVYVLLTGFVIKGVDLLYCLRNWMNILQNLALKRRDAIAEGWYPLNCYVGDFLRHM